MPDFFVPEISISDLDAFPVYGFQRAHSIDEGSYQRIVSIRPLEKKIEPIVNHNLALIARTKELAAWYRGETDVCDGELLSTLLCPDINHGCELLRSFTATALNFLPGEFPANCGAVRRLVFTTRYLIHALKEITPHPVFNNALFHMSQFFFALGGPHAEIYAPSDWGKRVSTCLQRMIESFQAIADFFGDLERQRGKEIAEATPHVPSVTVEDVKNAANAAAEKVNEHTTAAAKEAVNEVTAEMRIATADVKDHTTAETTAAVTEVKKTVRKAKRAIIKDAHTAKQSEADLRTPKGERARQIAAVRAMLKNAARDGKKMTVLTACKKVWKPIKGGYPTQNALYQYCHAHLEN